MKIISTILILFISKTLSGQVTEHRLQTIPYDHQNKVWLEKIENPEFESFKLKKDNFVKEFYQFDFSTLLIPRFNFLGFLDTNYQRIKIYFTSVAKSADDSLLYEVKGISLVNDNKCNFIGNLKINQIRKYKNKEYSTDHRLKDDGLEEEGILIGDYLFTEDSTQTHSGIFEGILTMYWYLDKHNILRYDDLDMTLSDRFFNNQYVGTWREYGKTKMKICNWGEFRIPFSGDLDIGAGEFSPNPKYFKNGWADYETR